MEEDRNVNTGPIEAGSPDESSAGPIIGTIIILIVIVLGGLYFWSQSKDGARDENVDQVVEEINTQSESDDALDIEADLEATELDDLGSELDDSTF